VSEHYSAPLRRPHRHASLVLLSLGLLILLTAGVLLAAGFPQTHASQINGPDSEFSTDSAPVVGPLNCTGNCNVLGQSGILRTDRRITFTIRAIGLQRSTVYSIWAFAFNNPDACAASPCSTEDLGNPDTHPSLFRVAAGLSDQSGNATFGGEIARNNQGGRTIFGAGLTIPRNAELHFVWRNHGQPIAGQVQVQMREYLGAAPPTSAAASTRPPRFTRPIPLAIVNHTLTHQTAHEGPPSLPLCDQERRSTTDPVDQRPRRSQPRSRPRKDHS
jgi:hypothetical protein